MTKIRYSGYRFPSADYIVGYGRPPKATQFAAGKSGNRRGRPKASRTVGAVLQDIFRQKIAVTENGKTRRIPTLEVMLRRLANDALRSDAKAMKLLLSLVDRYADATEAKVQLDELLAEDQQILAQYLTEPAALVAEPAAKADDDEEGDVDAPCPRMRPRVSVPRKSVSQMTVELGPAPHPRRIQTGAQAPHHGRHG